MLLSYGCIGNIIGNSFSEIINKVVNDGKIHQRIRWPTSPITQIDLTGRLVRCPRRKSVRLMYGEVVDIVTNCKFSLTNIRLWSEKLGEALKCNKGICMVLFLAWQLNEGKEYIIGPARTFKHIKGVDLPSNALM